MSQYVWAKRSAEWIKENPGKGTMYKIPIEQKEEIKKEVKNLMISRAEKKKIELQTKTCGVYAIVCEVEKMAYIGESFNVEVRMRNHKMCINNASSSAVMYKLMNYHQGKHGKNAFQFIKMHEIDNNGMKDELLIKEAETMHEFIEMGYKLYNQSIPANPNSVICPKHLAEDIKAIISKVKDNTELLSKMLALID